jgi:hypothetical protein
MTMTTKSTAPTMVAHGALRVPGVTIDAYNAELRAGKRFIGDRASTRVFREILDKGRAEMRKAGSDPLGAKPTKELSKKKLDKVLVDGDPEAAGVVQGAIEEFAAELAKVAACLLELKAWRAIARLVVGGGLRASRIGELAIGRASVLLKADGHELEMRPIHHHPDEAGLIGAVHLAPPWMFAGHDAILALDIGGSNIRAGVVVLNWKKAADLSHTAVGSAELWEYGKEERKPSVSTSCRRSLPRHHRCGRLDRARWPELAGQLGK